MYMYSSALLRDITQALHDPWSKKSHTFCHRILIYFFKIAFQSNSLQLKLKTLYPNTASWKVVCDSEAFLVIFIRLVPFRHVYQYGNQYIYICRWYMLKNYPPLSVKSILKHQINERELWLDKWRIQVNREECAQYNIYS